METRKITSRLHAFAISKDCRFGVAPFLAALQFLTVFPVPGVHRGRPPLLSASLVYFPVVGAALGGLLAVADYLLRQWMPPLPAAALLVALLAVLTGALHLDGVADSCDGLLSHGRRPSERLEIMRDAGLGAFGLLGLLAMLLLQVAALATLPAAARAGVLVAALALGRWAIVYSYAAYPYARREAGPSASLKAGASRRVLAVATTVALLVSLLVGVHGVVIAAIVGIAALPIVGAMARSIGGITGDLCGAACEMTQTLALVVSSVFFHLSD